MSRMRDLSEELKNIRNSEYRPPPTLKEIEEIAENASKPDYTQTARRLAIVDRMLPECYTTFTFTNINIQNLHEETLFYIFYAVTESDLQVKAYNELISKGYMFSKTLDSFVMLSDPRVADGKKHNVIMFEPNDWGKVTRSVLFDEAFLAGLVSQVADD